MTSLWLSPQWTNNNENCRSFDQILKLQGICFRDLPNRKTFQFKQPKHSYFIKIHYGVGWKEIFKNLLRLRLPIVSAKTEALALQKMVKYNIPTMILRGFGERGINPASKQSFVITDEVTNAMDLERFIHSPEYHNLAPRYKINILQQLANAAKKFHDAGFVHNDFYLCHFLLKQEHYDKPDLYIIDCHRVKHYRHLPPSQRVRDLAALYFSSLDLPLTKRDRLRFVQAYFDLPLRDCLTQQSSLLNKLTRRTSKLYTRVHGREAQLSAGQLTGTASNLPFELQYIEPIFAYQGNYLATSRLNDIFRVTHQQQDFFVKRYYAAGKGLRRYIGRSRCRGEIDNLAYFEQLGLSTPKVVGVFEQKRLGMFKRGVIITQALANVVDLKTCKLTLPDLFTDKAWRNRLLNRIADITRLLHSQKFIHQDLKWRNLLINPQQYQDITLIDCPLGHKRYFHWYTRGAIKDLMSLDKEANGFISKTDRLRFYLRYQGKDHLDADDKRFIARIHAAYR